MSRIGEVIEGKYEILKEVGRGGMSVVYLAMDNRLNKQWAVKEIKRKGKNSENQIVVQSLLSEANLSEKVRPSKSSENSGYHRKRTDNLYCYGLHRR